MNAKEMIQNEKGMALMLAMVMLVMLTLIGLAAINSSTTEVALSGNYRLSADSFYVAESGLAYVMTNGTSLTGTGTAGTQVAIGSKQANVTMTYINTALAPAGSGTGIRTVRTADYYAIKSTGTSASGTSAQEEIVGRLNPTTY